MTATAPQRRFNGSLGHDEKLPDVPLWKPLPHELKPGARARMDAKRRELEERSVEGQLREVWEA